jgi:hypothetical protein
MNILFITHDFGAGGAERSLCILAPQLSASGHSIVIVSLTQPRPERNPWQIYFHLGIDVHHLPFPWIAFEYVMTTTPSTAYSARMRRLHAETLRTLRDFSPDVVCFNGYPSTSLAPFTRARRKILLAIDLLKNGTPLFPQSVRLLRHNVDKAVAIGPAELSQLQEIGFKAGMVFNSARSTPSLVAIKPIPSLHLGCFSKRYGDKGRALLDAACLAIRNNLRRSNAHVHLYGDGDGTYLVGPENMAKKLKQIKSYSEIAYFE